VAKVVKDVAARAGLTGVTPRVLRSSFATHLLERGADIRVVQALMGHSHLTATEPYLSVSNRRVAAAYAHYHPR